MKPAQTKLPEEVELSRLGPYSSPTPPPAETTPPAPAPATVNLKGLSLHSSPMPNLTETTLLSKNHRSMPTTAESASSSSSSSPEETIELDDLHLSNPASKNHQSIPTTAESPSSSSSSSPEETTELDDLDRCSREVNSRVVSIISTFKKDHLEISPIMVNTIIGIYESFIEAFPSSRKALQLIKNYTEQRIKQGKSLFVEGKYSMECKLLAAGLVDYMLRERIVALFSKLRLTEHAHNEASKCEETLKGLQGYADKIRCQYSKMPSEEDIRGALLQPESSLRKITTEALSSFPAAFACYCRRPKKKLIQISTPYGYYMIEEKSSPIDVFANQVSAAFARLVKERKLKVDSSLSAVTAVSSSSSLNAVIPWEKEIAEVIEEARVSSEEALDFVEKYIAQGTRQNKGRFFAIFQECPKTSELLVATLVALMINKRIIELCILLWPEKRSANEKRAERNKAKLQEYVHEIIHTYSITPLTKRYLEKFKENIQQTLLQPGSSLHKMVTEALSSFPAAFNPNFSLSSKKEDQIPLLAKDLLPKLFESLVRDRSIFLEWDTTHSYYYSYCL